MEDCLDSSARALFYRNMFQEPMTIMLDFLAGSLDFDSGGSRNSALRNVRGSRSIG
jgi:hypothetical protein